MEKKLYRKVRSKNIAIEHVCEVGVFLPQLSNILDFIVAGKIRTTLVEPDPKSINAIREYFRDFANVTLIPFAVYDYNGELELVQRNASTFAAALPYSPAQVNDDYHIRKEDTFTVTCKTFDGLDDGKIDLLSVDTEGCEWYILKYLTSRPLVISLETHGKSYVNPFMKEILAWMADNGYEKWFMDKTDTVYSRKGAFEKSSWENIQLSAMSAYVQFRRLRKRAGKFFAARKNV